MNNIEEVESKIPELIKTFRINLNEKKMTPTPYLLFSTIHIRYK